MSSLDRLSDLRRRRLDLADAGRALMEVARSCGDQRREVEVRELLSGIASGRFELAVAGQFSRGKSTLMNALLGGDWLPMGAVPMTSVVTTVRYGPEPRAFVSSGPSALPIRVPVAELPQFLTRHGAGRKRSGATAATVELPAELLRLGFEFVDTPGVGSTAEASSAATMRYLPRADAVLFVTSFDSPLTEPEADFLRLAAAGAGKVFLVINKRDLVSEPEAIEVGAFVRAWAGQHLGRELPEVFAVSALDGLRGALKADAELIAASGIADLRSALAQFLAVEQGAARERHHARALDALLASQERDLRVASVAAAAGRDAAEVAVALDRQLADIGTQARALATDLAAAAGHAVAWLFAQHAEEWRDALVKAVVTALATDDHEPSRVVDRDTGTTSPDEVTAALATAGTAWLTDLSGEVYDVVLAQAGKTIGGLLGFARSPRIVGARLLGLPAETGVAAGWSADELPAFATPVVAWQGPASDARPRPWSRRRPGAGAAAWLPALGAAADRFIAAARSGFADSADRWARALVADSEQLTAAEATQFCRYLQPGTYDDALEVVTGLRARVRELLLVVSPEAGSGSRTARRNLAGERVERPEQPPAAFTTCHVCQQMEEAVTEYLMSTQRSLASREAVQARHAEAGGFCALHTWQYAHFASPLGISAGYARLAAAAANSLKRIAQTSSPASWGDDVHELESHVRCPVCTVRDETEAQSIAGATARVEVWLCLHHTAAVLRAGVPARDGRHLIRRLANGLAQGSEDMRAYALKRAALRRDLISADEAQAYQRVLQVLAGRPALAQAVRDPEEG